MVGRLTQDVTEGCRKFIEKIQTCRPTHVLVKVKVHTVAGHEDPEVAYSLASTSARDWGGWVVIATPRPLYPGKEGRYLLHRRLSGPQGRSGKCRLHRVSIPGPSSP